MRQCPGWEAFLFLDSIDEMPPCTIQYAPRSYTTSIDFVYQVSILVVPPGCRVIFRVYHSMPEPPPHCIFFAYIELALLLRWSLHGTLLRHRCQWLLTDTWYLVFGKPIHWQPNLLRTSQGWPCWPFRPAPAKPFYRTITSGEYVLLFLQGHTSMITLKYLGMISATFLERSCTVDTSQTPGIVAQTTCTWRWVAREEDSQVPAFILWNTRCQVA